MLPDIFKGYINISYNNYSFQCLCGIMHAIQLSSMDMLSVSVNGHKANGTVLAKKKTYSSE